MNTKVFSLTSVFVLLLLLGCSESNDVSYSQEFEIQVNHSLKTVDKKYVINFDSVFMDSRCPMEADCVWSGVAGVRFTISKKNSSFRTVEVYTLNNQSYSDSVVFDELKIKLLGLSPYPSISHKINYSEYVAKIQLSKIH